MKAAFLTGREKFEIREVPIPEVSRDEVLIKIQVTGICGSDVHVFKGEQDYEYPIAIGHEIVGTVAGTGRDVSNVQMVDRVTILPSETCGECGFCKKGKTNLCDNIKCIGEMPENGGFAEYIKAKSEMVYKIPDDLSLEEASLIEPVAAAHYIANNIYRKYGNALSVGIIGVGTIGLLVLQVLRNWFKIGKLYGFDILENRLVLAEKLGAEKAFNTLKPFPDSWPSRSFDSPDLYKSGVFDVMIDCAATTESLNNALKLVKKDGRVVLVGEPSGPIILDTVSLKLIVLGEIVLVGSMQYQAVDFYKAMEILQNHAVDSDAMITKTEPLENVENAFKEYITKHDYQIKVLVKS